MADRPLGTNAAAELLGRHADTLRRWRSNGIGPAYSKRLGRAYYHRQDLVAWLEDGRRGEKRAAHARGTELEEELANEPGASQRDVSAPGTEGQQHETDTPDPSG